MEGNTVPSLNALQAVCDAFGITMANFFAENDMIEVSPETKKIIDNWNYLTKEERLSIEAIIDNYLSSRQ